MLTSDLVRAVVRAGVLRPRWIETSKGATLDDAAQVIARFVDHLGQKAGRLNEAIDDLAAARTDVIFIRGLAKLCWDRSTVTVAQSVRADSTVVTPSEVRAVVFGLAGESGAVRPGGGTGFTAREVVLARAAETLGLSVEAVEAGLYADRVDEQTLLTFEVPTPEALLEHYQLALAQGCLLRAREVKVVMVGVEAKRARALFRELKFRRLLFRAIQSPATHVKGKAPKAATLVLTLDGPLSLFKQTTRYGLQLALFLPALVRCETWSLEASVAWGPQRREVLLKLDQDSPLIAKGRDTGVWVSAEEENFLKTFRALGTPWELADEAAVLDLDGRDVLIPDLMVRHPDGREAFIEFVFAWRRAGFLARLELLAAAAPRNLVLVVAEKGGLDDGGLPEDEVQGPAICRMKGVVLPKKVLAALERVARLPVQETEAEACGERQGAAKVRSKVRSKAKARSVDATTRARDSSGATSVLKASTAPKASTVPKASKD